MLYLLAYTLEVTFAIDLEGPLSGSTILPYFSVCMSLIPTWPKSALIYSDCEPIIKKLFLKPKGGFELFYLEVNLGELLSIDIEILFDPSLDKISLYLNC